MIATYMERYATPAGLDGISPEQFLDVFGRSTGQPGRLLEPRGGAA